MLCTKLVSYWDKYTEMQHGQQNVKIIVVLHKLHTDGEGPVFV